MRGIDREAAAEVIEILNHSEDEIINKIPEKFRKFLVDNADNQYSVNIDFNNKNWDDTIKKETKVMLALIYRDYIVTKEEREKMLKDEKEELDKEERELHERYNPDNLFKKKESKSDENSIELNNMQLIEIKEEIWLKKIWKKIKSFFVKK